MARFRGKKNRIARRFGINIFGRLRNPLLHKPNPPGMHGAKRRKKSDFGLQLEEKQKLKAVYGMLSEKQLLKYYKEAFRRTGPTPTLLMQQLECRLDVLVYRLKFGSTIFAAQQLVSHGHICVDGKKVDRRSFAVKPGMTISIKEGSRSMKAIAQALDSSLKSVPEYLTLNREAFSGQLVALPTLELIPLPIEIDTHEVCDFLAHNG